jgi:hypothetical protein
MNDAIKIADNGEIEIKKNARSCGDCRKNTTCFLLREMIAYQKSWDGANGTFLKFPFIPLQLAQQCPEYESPLEVQKIKEIPN